jgi:hypothetical protein
MPYKNKSEHDEAVKRIHQANHELLIQAKLLFGIPIDKRRKTNK